MIDRTANPKKGAGTGNSSKTLVRRWMKEMWSELSLSLLRVATRCNLGRSLGPHSEAAPLHVQIFDGVRSNN